MMWYDLWVWSGLWIDPGVWCQSTLIRTAGSINALLAHYPDHNSGRKNHFLR